MSTIDGFVNTKAVSSLGHGDSRDDDLFTALVSVRSVVDLKLGLAGIATFQELNLSTTHHLGRPGTHRRRRVWDGVDESDGRTFPSARSLSYKHHAPATIIVSS